MFNGLKIFGSGPAVYITPEKIFTIHGISITNSIFYGWIAGIILLVVFILVARRITVRPKGGLIQFVEVGVTYMSNLVESSFEDPERGAKYVPYFVSLFFFLLFNNWLGLLPGVGEAFQSHGNPLFRSFTGDLNATLAVGIVTMGLVYVASIKEAGLKDYLKHFFVGNPLNPMYLFLGMIEMTTDFTRVISLSIRLFLNVTIGEIVIAVFAYLGSFFAPLTAAPFTLIELFVGALQAYIFVILSVMYLAIAVNHATANHDQDLTDESVPETMRLQSEKA
ncbi:MAG TPA: F0F1 ATP synthase subunit A [Candidatus Dormibacteraeota bacterium]|nr:F0F1 ATP synthase subunit A [Candidatus Dormibacteraeota bacterium]